MDLQRQIQDLKSRAEMWQTLAYFLLKEFVGEDGEFSIDMWSKELMEQDFDHYITSWHDQLSNPPAIRFRLKKKPQ